MKNFEKNFMGMFEKMAEQLEGMDDEEETGEAEDVFGKDGMPDEASMKEAEKMMQNMLGALSGMAPPAGAPGAEEQGIPNEKDLAAMIANMGNMFEQPDQK